MLGVAVMDELHMLDDESRGYILELMATKLLSLEQEVQIIGESPQENSLTDPHHAARFLVITT